MPGQLQTLSVPPPVSVPTLLNAIRVGLVNLNNPGTITYDPLAVPPPPVSVQTLYYAIYNAAGGEIQS
jgi:hypothetical protein